MEQDSLRLTFYSDKGECIDLSAICKKIEGMREKEFRIRNRTNTYLHIECPYAYRKITSFQLRKRGDISVILNKESLNGNLLDIFQYAVGLLESTEISELMAKNLRGDVIDISLSYPRNDEKEKLQKKVEELGSSVFGRYKLTLHELEHNTFCWFTIRQDMLPMNMDELRRYSKKHDV